MSALNEWLADCYYDPLKFVQEAFPWGEGELSDFEGPDVWQASFLSDVGRSCEMADKFDKNDPNLDEETKKLGGVARMAVASGHGIGKTCVTAWIILWFQSTRRNAFARITANTEKQLLTVDWRELAKWHKLSIVRHMFTWEKMSFRAKSSPETWVAHATPWSATNPEAFSGMHESNVLLLMDEAAGIDRAIYERAWGVLTTKGALWIVMGNPSRPEGGFYDIFHGKDAKYWNTRHIDARTTIRNETGALDQLVDIHGLDNDITRVRVLGQFPRSGTYQAIPRDVVEEAQARRLTHEQAEEFPLVMGVDVARFGDDETAIIWRRGHKIVDIKTHAKLDTFQTARLVSNYLKQRPALCFVDEIGVGAGVVDTLRNSGHDIIGVQVSRKPSNPKAYLNLRAELWMGDMLEWLRKADIPETQYGQQLADELCSPEYAVQKTTMQIVLENKDMMKKRGATSPNIADALAITFAMPHASAPPIEDDDFFENPFSVGGRDQVTGY